MDWFKIRWVGRTDGWVGQVGKYVTLSRGYVVQVGKESRLGR